MQACGHPCCGIKGEKQCPPCMFEECVKKNNSEISGDDYCNICFVEGLIAAPCIIAKCGHAFHFHCL